MRDLYQVFDDPYVYRGTDILKNKLGIRDAATLESFELEMTLLRSDEPLPVGRLSQTHYRSVHRHIFQDVYRWAGRYRTVRTGKGGNWFCYPENISTQMSKLFAELQERQFLETTTEKEFPQAAAWFLSELNAIHPFREGNGRTQLIFLDLLAVRASHPLDVGKVRAEAFLSAMIESFSGRLEPLADEIKFLRLG
jgi:cell filamentation protein